MPFMRPAEPLKVAVFALEGTPALQLTPVPQAPEEVLVQVSTWARAATAESDTAAIASSFAIVRFPMRGPLAPDRRSRRRVDISLGVTGSDVPSWGRLQRRPWSGHRGRADCRPGRAP